ncbi:Asparagine synthetase [glutamine-hydrolyzing] 1 [Thalassocella blandensis]|nr:Asparagine synthetase [glutamine-hydrolyzing] 1 [Thalassocella blandensis]
MCGIVGGMYFENNSANAAKLERAVTLLHHRGPDEFGIHMVNNVGLGHARLSIIDLSGGKQPLRNADGNLHLVANGEIYNYIEVVEKYPNVSKNSLSHSDSEAILQVYEERGISGITELNGMFAFALYDEREDVLILARDRLGIKPLYYCQTSEGIFYASEIKALLPLMNITPEINSDALVQFLLHQFSTGRDTIFKDIKRILPGEYLTIRNREIHHHIYWDLKNVQSRDISLEEAFEEFEPLLRKVMNEHIRSDVPFGLFLSGGIDSSILLAELSKLHSHDLKTYSIGFTGTNMKDELDAATILAKKFGTDHVPIRVSREDLFGRIVHSIWASDDLMRDYASLPTLALSEAAAQDVKVVFSGEAGDEAFAGYRRYAPSIPRWINHRILGRGVRTQSQWKAFAEEAILTPSLKSINPRAPFEALWNSTPADWSLMKKRQFVDVRAALVDNLFVKTDRMMMAYGLEGRVPLADHRIVEFGFSLPDKLKYRNNLGKWILRQWAEKYLPKDHLRKPKRGFYVPVTEWLQGSFADNLGQKLLQNKAIQTWMDIEGVKQVIAAHKQGKNYSRELFCLMQFAIWHRLFIEKPGVVPSKNENPLEWV